MKRFIMVLVMGFVLFVSCVTVRGKPKYWEQYLEFKQRHISMIEQNLTADMYIVLYNYLQEAWRLYYHTDESHEISVYYKDYEEDVYNKYLPIVERHNEEYAIRQKQKDDEWVRLSMKKIPGSRDWVVFQNNYNLKQIYSSMRYASNSVNRLRFEMIMKEMSAYIKDKNLVFNEEQSVWYKNVNDCLINIAFALNVNFGMSERDFQAYLSQSLDKFNRYVE